MQCAKLLGQRDMLLKVFGFFFFLEKKAVALLAQQT